MLDTNTQMRLTGLATGLDTDAIIQNLGKAHNVRIDKVKKDKQLLLWKQEAYRSTINMVNTMLKSNFNAANPAGNFRSASAFAKFSYNLSLGGSVTEAAKAKVSSIVSVTANGDLKKFNQTIESVAQLATKDKWAGDKIDLAGVTTKWKGGDGFDINNFVNTRDGSGYVTNASYATFTLSIDGVSRTIQVDGLKIKAIAEMDMGVDMDNPTEVAELKADQLDAFVNALNAEITKQFGKDYSGVVKAKDNELLFSKAGSILTLNENTGFDTLDIMGLKGGATSNVNIKKLDALDFGNLFQNSDKATIQINGKFIDISKDDTVTAVMSKINSSGAGVNLSYDPAGDRFVLTSSQEGSANNIKEITGDAAKFFEGLGIGKTVEYRDGTTVSNRLIMGNDLDEMDTNSIISWVDGNGDKRYIMKQPDGLFAYGSYLPDGTMDTGNDVYGLSAAEAIEYMGGVAGSREEGQNLIAMINGEKYVRQSNTFTHEGMTFKFTETFNAARYVGGEFLTDAELNADTVLKDSLDPAIKIQVDKNTADVVESIKSFVEEYNKLVDHINGLLTEKREKRGEYNPLSDDEKKAMKEEDIAAYEAKARSGIMANDSELRKLLDQMRSSIYQKVEGVGLTMSEIGITTSANWKDGGRLVIDDNKLTEAIENRYDDVVALFTKPDAGVSQRLYSVLNDAAGLTGDKGYIVQKAGAVNDGTQYQNEIQKKLDQYDKRLDTLLERWYRQENQYYKMFARMESAMMKMQSQQNSLASLMAQSGGS